MIHTRIARIISPSLVVLAAGTDQGVQEGMEFVIYELGDTVLDPETNEPLGQIEVIKGRLQVSHVQDRISHATTMGHSRTETIDPWSVTSGAIISFPPKQVVTRTVYEELPVEGAVALEVDMKVRVGDRVRSVR